ncbi:hypothetical protein EMGBD1_20990 [Anaerolineaceae bacterium]|nr:hypothetical protein EMGBD1_20990 [Anaerolineaceae bacterium]
MVGTVGGQVPQAIKFSWRAAGLASMAATMLVPSFSGARTIGITRWPAAGVMPSANVPRRLPSFCNSRPAGNTTSSAVLDAANVSPASSTPPTIGGAGTPRTIATARGMPAISVCNSAVLSSDGTKRHVLPSHACSSKSSASVAAGGNGMLSATRAGSAPVVSIWKIGPAAELNSGSFPLAACRLNAAAVSSRMLNLKS